MTVGAHIGPGNHSFVANIGDDGALVVHVKLTFRVRLIAYGTVRGLNKELRLAVLIHVIKHELIEVCA